MIWLKIAKFGMYKTNLYSSGCYVVCIYTQTDIERGHLSLPHPRGSVYIPPTPHLQIKLPAQMKSDNIAFKPCECLYLTCRTS
jgi:hypothetical protein